MIRRKMQTQKKKEKEIAQLKNNIQIENIKRYQRRIKA